MREITASEYWRFLAQQNSVTVGQAEIRLRGPQRPKTLQPPDFKTETSTLWSFPKRGNWATHRAGYRSNWAPQIARNLILRYSQPGDTVLDQMVGGGTTMVECRLTGRRGIGVDINPDALMLTMDALNFELSALPAQETAHPGPVLNGAEEPIAEAVRREPVEPSEPMLSGVEGRVPAIILYEGDARNLDRISDGSIDLVATHPPYANIIRYSRPAVRKASTAHLGPVLSGVAEPVEGLVEGRTAPIAGDFSNVRSIAQYVEQMRLVVAEAYRVLRPDHYCAVLMGDTRRSRHYTPIAFRVMQAFLEAGFILKEDIIKAQWHTQTEGLWTRLSRDKNFLLIMHEHLFIFRKPTPDEDTRPYHESARWW